MQPATAQTAATTSRARARAALDELPVERAATLGLLPALALVMALGLLIAAFANNAGRDGAGWAEAGFWVAVVVIFAPAVARLASASAARRERFGIVVLLGLALYMVKVLHEPVEFTFHDELGHWRGVQDILASGGLFEENPIVRAYAVYPGLDVVSASLVKVGSMSIFSSGVVIIGLARIVLGAALFWLFEELSNSPRLAGLATALYMTNPNFLFFDSQFAYESFALPLFVFALLLVRKRSYAPRPLRFSVLFAVVAVAVVTSHHMNAYALCALLIIWTVSSWLVRRRLRRTPRAEAPEWLTARTAPVGLTVVVVIAALAWFFVVAREATAHGLGPVFSSLIDGLVDLVTGGGPDKKLFKSASGPSEPLWTQALGFASVAVILGGLAIGLVRLRRRRITAAGLALVLITLVYPFTLVLRLTQAGTETSNRAAEFLFVGIALVLAFAAIEVLLSPSPWAWAERLRRPLAIPAVVAGSLVLMIGGIAVGWPPYGRVPGPFLVSADLRSVSPEGTAAARFAGRELPPESRIVADRTTKLLLAAYGGQFPVGGDINGLPVVSIFFSRTFGERERAIVRGDELHYIAVDRRLSRELPYTGVYFERGEPNAQAHRVPLSAEALAKFDDVPDLSRVYDNGDIAIYDARAIVGAKGQ